MQCAQLAFDLRAKKLDREALKRELRHELGLPEGVSEKARDEVIEAVLEETEDDGGE